MFRCFNSSGISVNLLSDKLRTCKLVKFPNSFGISFNSLLDKTSSSKLVKLSI